MNNRTPDQDPGRRVSRHGSLSRGNPLTGVVDTYPPTRCPDALATPLPRPLFAGRYEILRELGRGGMGVVSQARDTRLPRDVAIKAPLHLRDPNDPDSLRRFFKEAEAAAKLDHPNIGRILDLGEADSLPFIVLAFIPGQTLAEYIDHRPVEPTRAAKIVRNIAKTVQFAHDRGIIHRDLKPSNLMIGPHRELIVMDFGLARLEGDERKTLTGQVFGTPAYMSPEQVQGQSRDMGKGCDIYALGVIFYELLTGVLPFRGPVWELPGQIVSVEPIPPSKLRPDVAPELDAIVLRAMAKKINNRFSSMAEFAEAIADYLRGIGSLSNSGMTPRLIPEPVKMAPTEPAFPVKLRREPLRDPQRSRFKIWDGLVWGSIAVLAVVGIDIVLAARAAPPKPLASTLNAVPAPVKSISTRSIRPERIDPDKDFKPYGKGTERPIPRPPPKPGARAPRRR